MFNGLNHSESQGVLPSSPLDKFRRAKTINFVHDPSASEVFKKRVSEDGMSESEEYLNNSIKIISQRENRPPP